MPDPTRDDAGAPGIAGPWRDLRRLQDRGRYLRILGTRRATGMPRQQHPLLLPPAAMTRTATNQPDPDQAREYVRHSCDLAMSGGLAAALLYPSAACVLAEHYVVRRVAGSSTPALAAAATAAAELGRGAPKPVPAPPAPGVLPGYAGLAEAVGWLAGDDPVRDGARPAPPDPAAEQWRLARMLQPAPGARPLFRLLTAAAHWDVGTGGQAFRRVLGAALAPPGRPAKAVLALLLLGSVLAWTGLSLSLALGAQGGGLPVAVAASSSAVLFIVVAMAATLALLLGFALSVLRWLRAQAEPHFYGLVPGVTPDGRQGRLAGWLDRRAGVPDPDGTVAISTWLADRLDDLAGLAGAERVLTFGDLWSGRTGARTLPDLDLLRRCAVDPEHRVIDLRLTTVNVSQQRPYAFPLQPAEIAVRRGGTAFLFCEQCLQSLVPARVVLHLVKTSPATETEHGCPRHERGVLRELPDPWDTPVALAVRMAMARPGLLAAVPLYSVEPASSDPDADEPGATAARTHWFVDAGPDGAPVDVFDRLLPRWPTFGLSLETGGGDGRVRLPEQDAATTHRDWRGTGLGAWAFASAAAAAGRGWRDALHADLPGLRGRIAQVHAARTILTPYLRQHDVLRLAGHGMEAGTVLRARFLGQDGEIAGQDQTDRYRWIRMRLALRNYRTMSLELAARVPLFTDLAASYRLPEALTGWFLMRPASGSPDPGWTDAATVLTTLRAMSAGGVLDFDAEDGTAPVLQQLRADPLD